MKRILFLSLLLLLLVAEAAADTAWFIAPYKRRVNEPRPTRYCAMDDFTSQIEADGGRWTETEVLGNRCIVKVRASATTLSAIAGTPTFRRIPLAALNNSLSTLTQGQRAAIRNELIDAGYTTAEINARFPNLAQATLGDVLRFLATRRLKPRYDKATDAIILDGAIQSVRSIDKVEAEVQ